MRPTSFYETVVICCISTLYIEYNEASKLWYSVGVLQVHGDIVVKLLNCAPQMRCPNLEMLISNQTQ